MAEEFVRAVDEMDFQSGLPQLPDDVLIDVAPDPGLARLDGPDQGMVARMEVLGGVLVLG